VEGRVVLPPRLVVRWRLVVAWSSSGGGSPSKEERAALIRSEGARKRATCKWTNYGQHPPPSQLPPAGSWAISSSSRRRARSPSFEDDVDWEGLEAEPAPEQRVLGSKDFIIDDDEAERRAFKLARRLSQVEAEEARQRAALEARTDVALVREYEQWQAEGATRRIKKEIVGLDNE
jgi:hypothetical protein